MERTKTIEILLALIFLVFVLMMILIVLQPTKHVKSTKISNSYNKVYINSQQKVQPKQIIVHEPKVVYSKKDNCYGKESCYYNSKGHKNHYSSWKSYDSEGEHKKFFLAGSYSDNYKVHVKNNDRSRYFKVRFHFEDGAGFERSHDMQKYIPADETKVFYFNDISGCKDKYSNWRYDIIEGTW